MPEGTGVETTQELSEPEDTAGHRRRWHELVEVAEVFILAIVAVMTAWTGLQAAKWDGQQSLLYGEANRDRFAADAASTLAGQQLGADASLFTAWLQARAAGDKGLQATYVRRFTPEYRDAFQAWLKTDPFVHPAAPPGPGYMPTYHNSNEEAAKRLNAQAADAFDRGTKARENAEKYVRDTVLFASVLFLIAVGQRFNAARGRVAIGIIAFGLLTFTVVSVLELPRL
jgi:hypothetical protein